MFSILLATAAVLGANENRQDPAGKTYSAPEPAGQKSWIGPDEYPAAVLRAGGQGAVGIRVHVDPKGKPYRCDVFASSGWPALDEVTCKTALARAKFTPAHTDGRPGYGSYIKFQSWVNPNGSAKQPAAYVKASVALNSNLIPAGKYALVELAYVVEPDGQVVLCKANDPSAPKQLVDLACGELRKSSVVISTDIVGTSVRSVRSEAVALVAADPPAMAPAGATYPADKQ